MPTSEVQDESTFGDPIPEAFPPDNPAARFVVSMSMAGNDINRALRDVVRAGEDDTPDFSYRVRILTGHLVEAIVAFNAYTDAFSEVRALNKKVPPDAQKHLKQFRGTLQKAGKKILDRARNNTFHYPAPNTAYKPTSDEELEKVLPTMASRGTEIHFDGDTKAITLTFADDIALELSTGIGQTTDDLVIHRAELARDGALAFFQWHMALLRTFMAEHGHSWGEPIVKPKN